jgi:hypothetical protein
MRFEFDSGSGIEIETMWVSPLKDGHYVVDNIPFYVPSISLGDVVNGAMQHSELVFKSVHQYSGHSTVRLVLFNVDDVSLVSSRLNLLGCDVEISEIRSLLAVDVPPSVAWASVQALLGEFVTAGLADYEESAISRVHVP